MSGDSQDYGALPPLPGDEELERALESGDADTVLQALIKLPAVRQATLRSLGTPPEPGVCGVQWPHTLRQELAKAISPSYEVD